MSAIQRSHGAADRPLHVEPVDAKLDGQAAVAERAARCLGQKVAESTVEVSRKPMPRCSQPWTVYVPGEAGTTGRSDKPQSRSVFGTACVV